MPAFSVLLVSLTSGFGPRLRAQGSCNGAAAGEPNLSPLGHLSLTAFIYQTDLFCRFPILKKGFLTKTYYHSMVLAVQGRASVGSPAYFPQPVKRLRSFCSMETERALSSLSSGFRDFRAPASPGLDPPSAPTPTAQARPEPEAGGSETAWAYSRAGGGGSRTRSPNKPYQHKYNIGILPKSMVSGTYLSYSGLVALGHIRKGLEIPGLQV